MKYLILLILTQIIPVLMSNNKKWNHPIKYWVDIYDFKDIIYDFLKKIEDQTCITFLNRPTYIEGEQGLLFLKTEDRTYSQHIGPSGTNQPNNIFVKYYWDIKHHKGLIEDAIFNALGAGPENQRCDRDEYLTMHKDRAKKEFLNDFNYNNYSCSFIKGTVAYDYGSLTHDTVWNKEISDKGPIFETKQFKNLYQKMMGHKEHAVFSDYKKLYFIHCSDKCKNLLNMCQHGGYPNAKNCKECICPHGYLGKHCETYVTSVLQVLIGPISSYGSIFLYATESSKEWGTTDRAIFYIFIIAPKNNRVYVRHKSSKSCYYNGDYCFDQRGHEIRYRADKGAMGICLCGAIDWPLDIVSEDNEVAIFYRGDCSYQLMLFDYQIHNENSKI
uniref:Astacin domain-containing protein n=1 Tax=Parastrongyloides trichosuri TaxID=131310 RepID=A0A0N5A5R5_PARTI